MEAHHLRPEGLDYRAICVIEGGSVCGSHLHLGIDIELGIVAFQSLAPLTIDKRVISCRGMAEEIHVDGSGSSLPELDQRFRKLSRSHLRGRQGAKSTCNSNRDSHLRRAGSGHRRLNDRELDVEKPLDPVIRPMCHGLPFGRRAQIVSSRFSLASSHEIPLPTLSEVRTIPSRIFSGSSIIASAQSTYSSQWAVGVAQSRWALISGIRCDDISMPWAAAMPAACSQPVTPPILATSAIT